MSVATIHSSVVASWQEIPAGVADPSFMGGKAVGLLKIPPLWTPKFITLTSKFHQQWSKCGTDAALCELPSNETGLLEELLGLARANDVQILVRSNSPIECGLQHRGRFKSIAAKPEMKAIESAIDVVLSQSQEAVVFALLQLAVEPGLPGHMSNERRVSPRRSLWLVEDSDRRFGQERISTNEFQDARDMQLTATSEKEVLQRLRSAAGFLETLGLGYHHCEWVWNGKNVSVVQSDPVDPPKSDLLANRYIHQRIPFSRETNAETYPLAHFSKVTSEAWRKLRRPRIFRKLGFPTADVFLLTGTAWKAENGSTSAAIRTALQEMCQYPVVVRCDVNSDNPEDYTFLPTSDPSTDLDFLLNFMDRVFRSKRVADDQFAFLLARLVPAKASAMVQAFPNAERVRIDALWGFPDGLLHFSHDSYFFEPGTGKIDKRIDHKGQCLLFRDGAWVYEDVGRPDDWDDVLDDIEIKTMSEWALLLAKDIGHQVQLMTLARIGGERGATACLPWHYTEFEIPKYTEAYRKLPMTKDITTIATPDALTSLAALQGGSTVQALLIKPDTASMRDAGFLEHVGLLAARLRIPVYFEGSLLGHSYYLLAKNGARVVPIMEEEPAPEVKRYDKLVRDEIPTIIKRAGGLARVKTLSRAEAQTLLAQKLIEESYEVWNAPQEALIEELADVLEVVDALRQQSGITSEQLEARRGHKRNSRGGFDKLIYLEETQAATLDATIDEELPLFKEERIDGQRKGSAVSNRVRIEKADIEGSDIFEASLPLIPPVRGGTRLKSHVTKIRDYELSVQYQKDQITVSLSRTERPVDENQLKLFEFDPKIVKNDARTTDKD